MKYDNNEYQWLSLRCHYKQLYNCLCHWGWCGEKNAESVAETKVHRFSLCAASINNNIFLFVLGDGKERRMRNHRNNVYKR